MIESSLLNFVENQLTLATRRQETLSANIANADTPGYRAQDLQFHDQVRLLGLDRTSGRHIASPEAGNRVRTFEVESKIKPNGNSVDLDRELTEVTKNGLEFITLMQFLQSKLRTLRSSISEGGNV